MPAKSLAQFIAMEEAKKGKSTLGIPKSVGEDFVAATPKSALKGLPKKVKKNGAFAGPGEGLATGHKKGEPPNLDKTYVPAAAAKGARSGAGRKGGVAKPGYGLVPDADGEDETSELVDDPKEEVRERSNAVPGERGKSAPAFGITGTKSQAQWFGKKGGALR